MQTIWSRAANAQASCRCRVCLNTANTLVRRSTTSAPRRKVSAADVFTACYTTIFGTAAVLDARRKDARRKELDESLERVKASLSELGIKDTAELPNDLGAEASAGGSSSAETTQWTRAADVSTILDEVGQLAVARYPLSSLFTRTQLDWIHAEAGIIAEERDPLINMRHPKNEMQLEKTRKVVEQLVQKLLQQARGPRTAPDQLLDETEALLENYPIYRNPQAYPEADAQDREFLSTTFRRILNNTTDTKEATVKICHNLLVSDTAPNIHNLNTLIAGFNRVGRPDLAQTVVKTFLGQTAWPATKQTIVCLLTHARGTNNLTLFREIVGRMRGAVEDGLHLRIFSKDLIFNEEGLEWVTSVAAERKSAYVERATRTMDIFDSLVRGWVHFGQLNHAGMSLVASFRNEQFVSAETLDELLTQCLSALDQNAARLLLEGMAKNLRNSEAFLEHVIAQTTSELAAKIVAMFCDLYDLCGFIYKPITPRGMKGVWRLLQRLRYHAVARLSQDAENTKALCHGINPVPFTHPGSFVPGKKSRRRDTNKSGPAFGVNIGSLAAAVKQYSLLEERIRRIEIHIKATTVNRLVGRDLFSNHLPPIVTARSEFRNQLVYQFNLAGGEGKALQAIHLDGSPITENDIKAQLLAGLPDQRLAEKFRKYGQWENISIPVLIAFYNPVLQQRGKKIVWWKEKARTKFQEAEDTVKAVLFCWLSATKQRRIQHHYPNWQLMPLGKVVEYFKKSNLEQGKRKIRVEKLEYLHGYVPKKDNEKDGGVRDGEAPSSADAG